MKQEPQICWHPCSTSPTVSSQGHPNKPSQPSNSFSLSRKIGFLLSRWSLLSWISLLPAGRIVFPAGYRNLAALGELMDTAGVVDPANESFAFQFAIAKTLPHKPKESEGCLILRVQSGKVADCRKLEFFQFLSQNPTLSVRKVTGVRVSKRQ